MSTLPRPSASQFIVIGERTNITGSPRFAKALKAGDWDACLAIARQQVESGANVIDINVDEALIDGEATMVEVPEPDRGRARDLARARHDRLLQVERPGGGP